MDIIVNYYRWNVELQKKYKSLWPNMERFNWDGVVSPEHYYNSNVKVMFLNREAYGDDYSINESICDEIREGKPFLGGEQTMMHMKTKNRLRVLSLLNNGVFSISEDNLKQFVDMYSEKEFAGDMLKVAYCNIKKSDGSEKSNRRDLHECSLKNKKILEEQISFFNPSVIVGGNIIDGILEDVMEWGDDLYKPHYANIFTLIVDGREYPFVDVYHPSCRKSNDVDSIELLKALQAVEKERPGYWKARCGLTCFEY